ncbi:MAG: hypothetical protein HC880_05750 [Bacteroidia bacterium]|nr:hypothetical protein [Bacteroidia bacterium]
MDSPLTGLRLVTAEVGDYSPDIYKYTSRIYFFSAGDVATYHVIRVAGFFSFFTFHTYTSIAILFAFFSFFGSWALYLAFYDMFPQMHRTLAVAIFFYTLSFFSGDLV